MGKIYLGVSDVAKQIKKIYIGVGGVAKEVKKTYIGVSGVAKEIFSSYAFPIFENFTRTQNESNYGFNGFSAAECIDAINHGATKIVYDFDLSVTGDNAYVDFVSQLYVHSGPFASQPSSIANNDRILQPYVSANNGTVSQTFNSEIALTPTQLANIQTNGLNLLLSVYQTGSRNVTGTVTIRKITFA